MDEWKSHRNKYYKALELFFSSNFTYHHILEREEKKKQNKLMY